MYSPSAIVTLLVTAISSGAAVIHFDSKYTGTVQDGSMDAPWKTLDKCFTTASPGDVCLLEPGDYNLASPTGGNIGRVTRNGTAEAPIRLEARLPGSVYIGAWHDITWRRKGLNPWLWESRFVTPLSANIRTLQSQTAPYLRQSGARLLYMPRHALLRPATWPISTDLFPKTARTRPGSYATSYFLETLPLLSERLEDAIIHVFRDEEQGAVARIVGTANEERVTVSIANPQSYDEMAARGGRRRYWITDHVDVIKEAGLGASTYMSFTQSFYINSDTDPGGTGLAMQISSVGPNLSGRSYWTFKGVTFYGVVPITDAASSNLRFESVFFTGVGLSQGMEDFTFSEPDMTGLVLRGNAHVVDRSDFQNCPNSCIEILGSGITVKNSVFSYSQTNGGAYSGTINIMGPNAVVRDNRLSELGVSGIAIATGARNAKVSNNFIENWGRLAYSRAGGVVAYDPAQGPCQIDSNMIFRQAIIDPPPSDPLPGGAINLVFGRDSAWVHHNIIDSAMVGIRLGGYAGGGAAEDNSWNNSIFSNSVGSGVKFSWLKIDMASPIPYYRTAIYNNIFRTDAGFQPYSATQWQNIYATGATDAIVGGSIGFNLTKTQDPLFQAPYYIDWDYRLGAGSPAIDAGVPYLMPDGSIVGILGAAPEVGAIEYGTNWRAGPKPPDPPPPGVSPVLGLDDNLLWTIPVDQPVTISTTNKVEGLGCFSIAPTGFKYLESNRVGSIYVNGLGFISFGVNVPALQSNPWWAGTVQVYLECPSRGVWNEWVGQVELTNLSKDTWHVARLPIPEHVATALRGKTFNDLKVRIAVNLNPGSGNLLLDDIRFEN